MAALRYERVLNADSSAAIANDQLSVYNPEQIDDTAAIFGRPNNFDAAFSTDNITLQDIFQETRLSPRQQRICYGITLSVSCIALLLLISLFAGFGKVLIDVVGHHEKLRHGLMMVPNVRKRPVNIFYFNLRNRTANTEYAKEIDSYLAQYAEYQNSMNKYLKNCSVTERNEGNRWCTFDFKQHFGSECSNATNYGYDSGNPCILFVFENRLGWKPNMKNDVAYLPFYCRMQYQYSSNVYANITYYPSLPTPMRNGGFQMNLIPNQKITDVNGNEVLGKDGDVLYSLPPMVMVRLKFGDVSSRLGRGDIGSFTLDCRIKDNVVGYQFDNMKYFKGQTAVSFDFIPRFS